MVYMLESLGGPGRDLHYFLTRRVATMKVPYLAVQVLLQGVDQYSLAGPTMTIG